MIIDPSTHAFGAPQGFIVLEGVNGAGKTTLQRGLAKALAAAGKETVETREPGGGTELGKAIRPLLLEHKGEKISSLAETFLFAADRSEHVQKLIRPSANAGKVVISDRYFYSTIVFQGAGRGISPETVERVSAIAIDGMLPDLVILLDLDPAEGLKRGQKRSSAEQASSKDSFEVEPLEFHKKIRTGFLDLARNRAEPFLVIDATASEEEILNRALTAVKKALRIS